MRNEPNVPATAFLMADPTRWAMLLALLDGRALPAGDLAYTAGVGAPTASAHLGKLVGGGLLAVEREGRHRYYRLAGAQVARAIEQLALTRPPGVVPRHPPTPGTQPLRFARTCYNHLAGRLGVALARALEEQGHIVAAPGKQYDVTPGGAAWFAAIGVDLATAHATRRGLARQCLDWTERRHHLAGPLGVALLGTFIDRGWLARAATPRIVTVTPTGAAQLKRHLGVDTATLHDGD